MKATAKKKIQQFIGQLEEFAELMRETADELSDTFDNRSEKWQDGDAGQRFQEEIDNVTESAEEAEALKDKLVEMIGE